MFRNAFRGTAPAGLAVRALPSLGAPCLRVRAKPVPEHMFNTAALYRLVEDLVDTMRDANGAGIAAPQIDEDWRVVSLQLSFTIIFVLSLSCRIV